MSYREIVQNLRDTLEDALDCKIHSEPRIAAAIALLAEADALSGPQSRRWRTTRPRRAMPSSISAGGRLE